MNEAEVEIYTMLVKAWAGHFQDCTIKNTVIIMKRYIVLNNRGLIEHTASPRELATLTLAGYPNPPTNRHAIEELFLEPRNCEILDRINSSHMPEEPMTETIRRARLKEQRTRVRAAECGTHGELLCRKCNQMKPADEFGAEGNPVRRSPQSLKVRGNRSYWCSDCSNEAKRAKYAENAKYREKQKERSKEQTQRLRQKNIQEGKSRASIEKIADVTGIECTELEMRMERAITLCLIAHGYPPNGVVKAQNSRSPGPVPLSLLLTLLEHHYKDDLLLHFPGGCTVKRINELEYRFPYRCVLRIENSTIWVCSAKHFKKYIRSKQYLTK